MAEITIIRKSPCYDVFKIAKDMDVDVTDVDDVLIERWAKEHALFKDITILELLYIHIIEATKREVMRLVENFAPELEKNDFHHELEDIKLTVTIERDFMDVVIKAKTCFQFENPNL